MRCDRISIKLSSRSCTRRRLFQAKPPPLQAPHIRDIPAGTTDVSTLLTLVCMTTQIKGYPFEVKITGARTSVVLADQIKSLDWSARGAIHKGEVTPMELAEVRAKIHALIGK